MSSVIPATSRSLRISEREVFVWKILLMALCTTVYSSIFCGVMSLFEFVIPFDLSSICLVAVAWLIGFTERGFYLERDSEKDLPAGLCGLAIMGLAIHLAYGNARWAVMLPVLVPGSYLLGVNLNRLRKRRMLRRSHE